MKFFARLSLLGSGIGLIFLTATPSFATVVGNLYTGGNGTVTVTPFGITFSENDTQGGSTQVGTGTTLTFAGGSVVAGQPIDIGSGVAITPLTPLPLANFMTFPDSPSLSVTLDAFGPGSTNSNCSGLTTGESCSPLIAGFTSPIILTYTGPGTEGAGPADVGTSALLTVTGTAMDSGLLVSNFTGHFSSSIADQTPAELAALFTTSGSSFTTTYSGDFVATPPSTVPEPRTISVVAMAGLLMGLVVAKRRKSVA
jgi:hypothetical protein